MGVENHEDLDCLVGAAGRAPVLMGGGAGFALESWFSGRGAVMARAGPARCGSWADWYFRKATPPMKPCLFPSLYPARGGGGALLSSGANEASESGDATRTMGGNVGGSREAAGERGRGLGCGGYGGCGETSRMLGGRSRCAAGSQTGFWSGSGEVGFDGARRWNRRCDSILSRKVGP